MKTRSILESSVVRVIRYCMQWLPFDFRRDFHADLEQTVLDEIEESSSRRSRAELLRTAWRSTVSVIRAAAYEHTLVFVADVRSALARAKKQPLATATIVVTFTIAFAINTVVLSAIDGLFWNPLPSADIERLVFMQETSAGLPLMSVAYPNYLDWRERLHSFEDMGAYRIAPMTMNIGSAADRVSVAQADPSLLLMLGLEVVAGRQLDRSDEAASSPPATIITESFWRSRFGGDEAAVGTPVLLNGSPHWIVGVVHDLPSLLPGVQAWVPLARRGETLADRSQHLGLWVVGRLRQGWTVEAAEVELRGVAAALGEEHPETNRGNSIRAFPLRAHVTAETRAPVLALSGAALCVSLIAALNVSGLLVVRWLRHSREAALRVALGSSFGRLTRQLVTESITLSIVSLAIGAGVGTLALRLIRWNSSEITEVRSLDVGVWVFSMSLIVAVAVGFVTALWPTRIGRRLDLYGILQAPDDVSRPAPLRLRSLLASCQVALATCLLIFAGLLAKAHVLHEPDTSVVNPTALLAVTVQTDTLLGGPPATAAIEQIAIDLQQTPTRGALAAIGSREPHVLGRQVSIHAPGGGWQNWVEVASVTPGYLSMLGLPLLSGRDFTSSDTRDSTPVVIVDDVIASRLWGSTQVGRQQLWIGGATRPLELDVIGVTSHFNAPDLDRQMGQIYLALEQQPALDLTYLFRSSTSIDQAKLDLRRVLTRHHPGSGIGPVETASEIVDRRSAPTLLAVRTFGVFATMSWVLALSGIYGVASTLVARQSPEFALRSALGARPAQVVRLVLLRSLGVALVGLAAGMVLAVSVGSSSAGILEGVRPTDPSVFLIVGAGVLATVLAASYLPARQASSSSMLQLMRSTA